MRYVALLAVVAALAFSGTALAGSGTSKDGYGSVGGNVQSALTAKPTKTGTLPFTGQSLVVWLVAGVVLVAAGGSLGRYARR